MILEQPNITTGRKRAAPEPVETSFPGTRAGLFDGSSSPSSFDLLLGAAEAADMMPPTTPASPEAASGASGKRRKRATVSTPGARGAKRARSKADGKVPAKTPAKIPAKGAGKGEGEPNTPPVLLPRWPPAMVLSDGRLVSILAQREAAPAGKGLPAVGGAAATVSTKAPVRGPGGKGPGGKGPQGIPGLLPMPASAWKAIAEAAKKGAKRTAQAQEQAKAASAPASVGGVPPAAAKAVECATSARGEGGAQAEPGSGGGVSPVHVEAGSPAAAKNGAKQMPPLMPLQRMQLLLALQQQQQQQPGKLPVKPDAAARPVSAAAGKTPAPLMRFPWSLDLSPLPLNLPIVLPEPTP